MRKRSKYRPKPVLRNPLGYVLESLTPVAQHDDHLINLKIKNHSSMAQLTQGKANKEDIDRLINSANMTEALYRLGFGAEYKDVITAGVGALLAVARRGAESGKFILRASEMQALNELMELHDAQMEVITIKDLEKGIALVENEQRQKKMISIIERK